MYVSLKRPMHYLNIPTVSEKVTDISDDKFTLNMEHLHKFRTPSTKILGYDSKTEHIGTRTYHHILLV
jgi:hypothetical protein